MDEQTPLPRWLCAAFVTVMLALALFVAWWAVEQYDLHFQTADVALSLDTSRQREAKQQYEYDEVVTQLPLVQAELAETQPLADEAEAQEQALRAQRKELRAQEKELTAQLETALATLEELTAHLQELQAQVDDLAAQEAALQAQLGLTD